MEVNFQIYHYWRSQCAMKGVNMDERLVGLQIHESDNVAVLFCSVSDGTYVTIYDSKRNAQKYAVVGNVDYGHKIALENIMRGQKIIKYGEVIGIANCDIKKGEHVHVKNVESLRGRGDLEGH